MQTYMVRDSKMFHVKHFYIVGIVGIGILWRIVANSPSGRRHDT